jgi:hypothetical protein
MATFLNMQPNQNHEQNTAISSSARDTETPSIRACINCVRAKAKCSPTTGIGAEGKCERYGEESNLYFAFYMIHSLSIRWQVPPYEEDLSTFTSNAQAANIEETRGATDL